MRRAMDACYSVSSEIKFLFVSRWFEIAKLPIFFINVFYK